MVSNAFAGRKERPDLAPRMACNAYLEFKFMLEALRSLASKSIPL